MLAITGFTASAQAGWSVDISFGTPVRFSPPMAVTAPCNPPPVVVCPPAPPPLRIVCAAPHPQRRIEVRDYRGHERERYDRGRGHDDHGHGFGGRH